MGENFSNENQMPEFIGNFFTSKPVALFKISMSCPNKCQQIITKKWRLLKFINFIHKKKKKNPKKNPEIIYDSE